MFLIIFIVTQHSLLIQRRKKIKKDSGQDFYLVLYDSFKKANIKRDTDNRCIFKRKQLMTAI